MTDCIFCRIIAGTAEGTFVYRDDRAVVFADLFPIETGHLLAAPVEHVETIYDVSEDLAAYLFSITARVCKAIKQVQKPDGITVLQANERAGGQEVFHFHIHMLPRFIGKRVLHLGVDRQRPTRAELEATFAPLRARLQAEKK